MTYQAEIKKWLSDYKVKNLKELPDGKWKRNNQYYTHILPESHQFKNLLLTYREPFLNSRFKNIKFHLDFHHLNSSQAMCINFFYPLIKEERLDVITQKLNLPKESIDYKAVCFEKDSEIEVNRRPTSFDFYIKTKSGKNISIGNRFYETEKNIYFEIKYTEQEFGKAKKDSEHINKYEAVYEKHNFVLNPKYRNLENFLNNYQIMRNLINVGKNNFIVFIYPENNKIIKQQAERAKAEFAIPEFRENVITLTWEELIEFVELKIKNSHALKLQLTEFKEKYKVNNF